LEWVCVTPLASFGNQGLRQFGLIHVGLGCQQGLDGFGRSGFDELAGEPLHRSRRGRWILRVDCDDQPTEAKAKVNPVNAGTSHVLPLILNDNASAIRAEVYQIPARTENLFLRGEQRY
jgi:hypothetical protein